MAEQIADDEPERRTREERINQTLEMFPNVDGNWIRQQFSAGPDVTVNHVLETILGGEIDVPKKARLLHASESFVESPALSPVAKKVKKTIRPTASAPTVQTQVARRPDVSKITNAYPDLFEQGGDEDTPVADVAALALLRLDFPIVGVQCLRRILKQSANHYAVAWALLTLAACQSDPPLVLTKTGRYQTDPQSRLHEREVNWGTSKVLVSISLLKSPRYEKRDGQLANKSDALKADIALVDQIVTQMTQPGSSSSLDHSGCADEGEQTTFECAICCEEYDLDAAVYCLAGEHMFCKRCVNAQATEVAYGQQGAPAGSLRCLDPSCDSFFPRRALKSVLEVALRKRLSEQVLESNIHLADLENFERCRFCNWGAIMDVPTTQDKVFRCANGKCLAEVCRLCGKNWDDEHIGKPCIELDKDRLDKARLAVEERMSEAVIRRCTKCKIPFDKIEGCNKMTCRCGFTMCYLCRTPSIDYNHFCAHPKDPEEAGCPMKCKKCMLWEVASVRDEKVLKDIQNEAKKEQLTVAAPAKVPVAAGQPVPIRQPQFAPAARPPLFRFPPPAGIQPPGLQLAGLQGYMLPRRVVHAERPIAPQIPVQVAPPNAPRQI